MRIHWFPPGHPGRLVDDYSHIGKGKTYTIGHTATPLRQSHLNNIISDMEDKDNPVLDYDHFYAKALKEITGTSPMAIQRIKKHVGEKPLEVMLLKVQLTATHEFYKWKASWHEMDLKNRMAQFKDQFNIPPGATVAPEVETLEAFMIVDEQGENIVWTTSDNEETSKDMWISKYALGAENRKSGYNKWDYWQKLGFKIVPVKIIK